jgi:hypothetical protein
MQSIKKVSKIRKLNKFIRKSGAKNQLGREKNMNLIFLKTGFLLKSL